VAEKDAEQEGAAGDDLQKPLVHEGAPAGRPDDGNEAADDKVEVHEPGGAPSPRAPEAERVAPGSSDPE
jgi:hypothetical protein